MALAKAINPNDIQRDITNDLIKGIISRLHETFGDSYTFYAEDVPQGLKTPSFGVFSMSPIKSYGLTTRKYWEFPFDVVYFCDSKKPRQEWNTVEQKLALCLEWLDACNTKLRAEIQPPNFDSEQEVGHFYILYGLHLIDTYEEPDKMESAEIQRGEPKEDGTINKDNLDHIAGDCDDNGCPIDWR